VIYFVRLNETVAGLVAGLIAGLVIFSGTSTGVLLGLVTGALLGLVAGCFDGTSVVLVVVVSVLVDGTETSPNFLEVGIFTAGLPMAETHGRTAFRHAAAGLLQFSLFRRGGIR